jgi:hypothetical protein
MDYGLVMKSIIPFITNELLDSPGCMRAVITTPFRFFISSGEPFSVIVKTSN